MNNYNLEQITNMLQQYIIECTKPVFQFRRSKFDCIIPNNAIPRQIVTNIDKEEIIDIGDKFKIIYNKKIKELKKELFAKMLTKYDELANYEHGKLEERFRTFTLHRVFGDSGWASETFRKLKQSTVELNKYKKLDRFKIKASVHIDDLINRLLPNFVEIKNINQLEYIVDLARNRKIILGWVLINNELISINNRIRYKKLIFKNYGDLEQIKKNIKWFFIDHFKLFEKKNNDTNNEINNEINNETYVKEDEDITCNSYIASLINNKIDRDLLHILRKRINQYCRFYVNYMNLLGSGDGNRENRNILIKLFTKQIRKKVGMNTVQITYFDFDEQHKLLFDAMEELLQLTKENKDKQQQIGRDIMIYTKKIIFDEIIDVDDTSKGYFEDIIYRMCIYTEQLLIPLSHHTFYQNKRISSKNCDYTFYENCHTVEWLRQSNLEFIKKYPELYTVLDSYLSLEDADIYRYLEFIDCIMTVNHLETMFGLTKESHYVVI